MSRFTEREDDYADIGPAYIEVVTEKAVRIFFDDEWFWVPLSVLRHGLSNDIFAGNWTDLEVQEWFARKAEMI